MFFNSITSYFVGMVIIQLLLYILKTNWNIFGVLVSVFKIVKSSSSSFEFIEFIRRVHPVHPVHRVH